MSFLNLPPQASQAPQGGTVPVGTSPTGGIYTGRGVGIAFLDTGISPVTDFIRPQNRIVAFRDFIGGKRTAYDDNGHGTHVTATEKAPFQTEGGFFRSSICVATTKRRVGGTVFYANRFGSAIEMAGT